MSNWGNSLQPSGTGQGNNMQSMFETALDVGQQTGLNQQIAGAAMNMVSRPLGNEDQLGKIYHLFAAHPNEVSTFFLHHLNEKHQPALLAGLAQLISTIVRKEIYGFFHSEAFKGDYVNVEKAAELGYSSITDENIDMIIANMVPLQQIQNEIREADAQAMAIVQQAKFQALSVEQQQQHREQQWQAQQQQQQWQQQQQTMMPPQRPSLLKNLFKLGTVTAAGAVGGQGAQQVATNLMIEQPNQYNQQMYGQQQQMVQQPVQQSYNVGTGQPY
tara:strand:+ start:864 stop:1682 length:819 start_codon:yes stop_codon:yes gene_type:complete